MAEMLSPGVFIEEIDASTIVPTVSSSIAVFGGEFEKGPVGNYMLISNVDQLIDFYGHPTNSNYNQWYQAYNFLQYGNTLYVSRAASEDSTNATKAIGKKPDILTEDDFTFTEDSSGLSYSLDTGDTFDGIDVTFKIGNETITQTFEV